MEYIIELFRKYFDFHAAIESIVAFLPKLLSAILVFAFFVFLWKLVRRLFRMLFRRFTVDRTLQNFLVNVGKTVVYVFGFSAALTQMGVNPASILASLGIAGLTLGFAAKDALSNIISGLFIFWDRPFVVGDLIEIGGQYGRVEEISLRSTKVTTVDGKMISIPNTQIVNSMVVSYTNFPHLRLDIPFTVAPDEDLAKIRSLLFALVQDTNTYLSTPPPELVLNSINDYNIELIFRVWIRDEKQHIALRFQLREAILKTLLEAKVNMPYETLSVIMNKQQADT
ncbi:mechanosensitive ion channel family protein [Thermonema rossianum]|jgi:small conductance mechanosensitive channel|uniref:mechanosensitive ion channel family protein n=1 Tax=Thermonema rossianum TaxID=55505 RepID=UPI00068D0CFF|nr:mechanosensitive ion channel family protein [Thermonema rossianum]